MSPRRATLPGKDALFGPAPEAAPPPPAPEPEPAPVAPAPVLADPPPAAVPLPAREPGLTVPDSSRHVQLCVWIDPQVAAEVDRARARLLMDHGIKVTKSEIVEAILSPALPDLDALRQLLGR